MVRATIVFADGSKQMAHNLDDTQLRWQLRKLRTADEITADFSRGLAIRSVDNPDSIEIAREWKQEFVEQKLEIEARISVLKTVWYRNKVDLKRATVGCATAISELNGNIARLNLYLHKQSDSQRRAPQEKNINSQLRIERNSYREALVQTQAEIIYLQALLLEQFGIVARDYTFLEIAEDES